jgi:hypothetical protein
MKPSGPLGIIFGAALSFLSAACTHTVRTEPTTITADDVLAAASRVVDCEWAAVYRFDSAQRTVADLAEQVMGVCTVERIKAKLAVGLSPHDPQLEADDFKQAVGIVESARKAAPKKP